MAKQFERIETKLVHAGEAHVDGAVTTPVFQSAMFETAGGDYHAIRYIRLNNTPNHVALHQKLAAIENAEAALVFASGMAAITTSLLTVLKAGDHVLAQSCLYGGTHDFMTRDLAEFGIAHDFIDADKPHTWQASLKPTTRAIYVEGLTNPLLELADLEAVAAFAQANSLVSLIDNTFPSPINFRPAEWGFDLSLHSGTKYLNGHSDLVCGAVIGKAALVDRVKHKLDHLGGSLDPHACFLLQRGLKTLAVRVRHQSESAGRIARFLAGHAAVKRVNYPGLESHPQSKRAERLFDGMGGIMSFELKAGVAAAKRFMERVTIPLVAPSLGGPETLVTRPAATSHAGMRAEDRERLGITEGLVRVSVGLEAADELLADFGQALEG